MRPGSVKARHVWEAIEYYEDRELDQGLITKLATCAL